MIVIIFTEVICIISLVSILKDFHLNGGTKPSIRNERVFRNTQFVLVNKNVQRVELNLVTRFRWFFDDTRILAGDVGRKEEVLYIM